MAHYGKFPVRSKIVVENKVLEQVSSFSYLGSDISLDIDKDIEKKTNKFQHICGTINKTLKNKVTKSTKLKLYKTMAVPLILYGSESWIERKRDKSNIQSAEMRFLRTVKGCTRRDHIKNDDIREELGIFNLNEKIEEYREKWRLHLKRMNGDRIPVVVNNYRPSGRRDVGRPRKRWS